MNWEELESSWRKGISPVYLFWGPESFLQERYIKKLREKIISPQGEAFDYHQVEGEGARGEEWVMMAATPPVLSPRRMVVVKNLPLELAKAPSPALAEYLVSPSPTTCLVLCCREELHKGFKLLELVEAQGQAVAFLPLKGAKLKEWLVREAEAQGYRIHSRAVQLLVEGCGHDLRLLYGELEKLMTYAWGDRIIDEQKVKLLVPQALADTNIFALTDALGNRQLPLAVRYLRQFLQQGYSPLHLLSLLTRQIRLIYLYQIYRDQKDLAHDWGYRLSWSPKLPTMPAVSPSPRWPGPWRNCTGQKWA